MTFDQSHGHAALRRGRWSHSGAEYFLTCCTSDRQIGLADSPIVASIRREADRLRTESAWNLRTRVVMPDRLHSLVAVDTAFALTEAVRLFKGRLSPVLRNAGLRWQPAFFDHRMRPHEDRLPEFWYIFLNAYRAVLLASSEKWPGCFCDPPDWAWFSPLTNEEYPYPEWLP
jgi:REP element-mobilizing transposase RayT